MDGFTYHDIFATKGIEYLVIIAFLLLLIPFRILLNRGKTRQVAPERHQRGFLDRLPKGIYFTSNHLWAHLEPRGTVMIGPDEFLLRAIGSAGIQFARQAGDDVQKGDVLAEIRLDGKTLKLRAPFEGKITALNAEAALAPAGQPEPYGNGWIVRIEPENWKASSGSLFLAYEAVEFMKAEFARLRDFLQGHADPKGELRSLPLTLQDGGEPSEEFLASLPAEAWTRFEEEFLAIKGK